jgi:hypothetical protein
LSSLACFCSRHTAPAHPYTGSRSRASALYTMLLTASARELSCNLALRACQPRIVASSFFPFRATAVVY